MDEKRIFSDGILDGDEKFRALVEHSVVGIYIIVEGKFIYVNQRLAQIFGYDRNELIGKSNLELTYREDRKKVIDNIRKRTSGEKESIEYSFRGVTKDGEIRYLHVFGSSFIYEGKRAVIGTLIDETETVSAKKELERLARYDTLTGLFNRHIFTEEFRRSIELARRRGHRVALFIMDIDNFKRINDSLGHGEGDEVLKVVSQRIKKSIESEGGLLARIGGDEFAIIIEDFDTIDEIGSIARKLKAIMRKTIEIDNYRLRITLSIGISLFPEHGSDIKQLQKAADIALYQSKKNGKNGFAFYAHDDGELLAKIELENDLYKALERDEFELYLQPQVTLESGKAGSMEALIRWRHPSRGILLPGEFLELAGESGLLYRLDLIILEKVMKLLTSWKEKGYHLPVVSVNISNTLFHHSHFLKTMRRHKKIYEDICDSIELELTENIIMESGGGSVSLIHELGVLGYRLSIDDFGTGYSSLSHLKSLNVNKLKIDRTFVHDIVSHKNGQVIVKAIIAMGKTLGLEIVAEGVETEEELNILREFGCDSIQGFYYTRPVTADEIEKRWLSPQ